MKRLLLLVLLTFLIIGCTAEEKEYTKPTADTGSPEVTETDLPSEQSAKTTASTKSGPTFVTDDLKELAEKAGSLTSLEYSYSVFEKGTEGYYAHVYVKGDKMKQDIELGSGAYTKGTLYDTAYFDLSTGDIKAYCEDDDCDERNTVITSDASKFMAETPFDVLKSIENGYRSGSSMYDDRNCIIVEYESNGKKINVWMWDFKGIPLKYEVREGETLLKKVEFKTLVYNGVKDSQLEHQQLEE